MLLVSPYKTSKKSEMGTDSQKRRSYLQLIWSTLRGLGAFPPNGKPKKLDSPRVGPTWPFLPKPSASICVVPPWKNESTYV